MANMFGVDKTVLIFFQMHLSNKRKMALCYYEYLLLNLKGGAKYFVPWICVDVF